MTTQLCRRARQHRQRAGVTAKPTLSSDNLAAAVDALQDCVEAVTACAAAMLTEDDLQPLAPAVSRDMDCADVVTATRNVLTRANGELRKHGRGRRRCGPRAADRHRARPDRARRDHPAIGRRCVHRAADPAALAMLLSSL
ncbi:hypothetical protein [Saccharopolyspora sp. NPDC050642]|uniref:hypothetical protein n=1 Tax=Saccharopolyspora sp. NPDC050642 TaxID=3157099 RepID=UPI0033D3D1D0